MDAIFEAIVVPILGLIVRLYGYILGYWMDLCSLIAGKKIAFGYNNKKEFGDKGLLTFGILVFSMPCYFLFGWVGGFFLVF